MALQHILIAAGWDRARGAVVLRLEQLLFWQAVLEPPVFRPVQLPCVQLPCSYLVSASHPVTWCPRQCCTCMQALG